MASKIDQDLKQGAARRPKRSNLIADSLRQRIARDRLKPGDRLPNERTLMEEYACAKGTMREALRALEVTGLVKMRTGPTGGAEVQAVSVDAPIRQLRTYLHFLDLNFRDVYAVRGCVEVILAESIVGKLSEKQFAQLENNVRCCAQARAQGDLAAARRLELAFHEILRERCENPFLAFICGFINGVLRDLVDFRHDESDAQDAFGQHNLDCHRELIHAFRQGDQDGVKRIMQAHMCAAEAFMSRLDVSIQSDMLSADPRRKSRPLPGL